MKQPYATLEEEGAAAEAMAPPAEKEVPWRYQVQCGGAVYSMAYSPNGTTVAAGDASGMLTLCAAGLDPSHVAFLAAQSPLAVASLGSPIAPSIGLGLLRSPPPAAPSRATPPRRATWNGSSACATPSLTARHHK
jgi:hypothetical protein